MRKIKSTDAWVFYKLCQQVIDKMIRDSIHEVKYGQPFGPVPSQTMSGIITELAHQGALNRIVGTNVFTLDPTIYRLYYTRYYTTLVKDQRRQRWQFIINIILAAGAVLSAFFAGCSARKSVQDDAVYQSEQSQQEKGYDCKEKIILPIRTYFHIVNNLYDPLDRNET